MTDHSSLLDRIGVTPLAQRQLTEYLFAYVFQNRGSTNPRCEKEEALVQRMRGVLAGSEREVFEKLVAAKMITLGAKMPPGDTDVTTDAKYEPVLRALYQRFTDDYYARAYIVHLIIYQQENSMIQAGG